MYFKFSAIFTPIYPFTSFSVNICPGKTYEWSISRDECLVIDNKRTCEVLQLIQNIEHMFWPQILYDVMYF